MSGLESWHSFTLSVRALISSPPFRHHVFLDNMIRDRIIRGRVFNLQSGW